MSPNKYLSAIINKAKLCRIFQLLRRLFPSKQVPRNHNAPYGRKV